MKKPFHVPKCALLFTQLVLENGVLWNIDDDMLKDEIIRFDIKEDGINIKTLELREFKYGDNENKRCFKFISNLINMNTPILYSYTTNVNGSNYFLHCANRILLLNSSLTPMKTVIKYRFGQF